MVDNSIRFCTLRNLGKYPLAHAGKSRVHKVILHGMSNEGAFSFVKERKNKNRHIRCNTSTNNETKTEAFDINFDWRLGLALAGCSFEAYNGCVDEDMSLRQVSSNGTEITYVNKDFLKKKMSGIVRIHIISANGLKDADKIPGTLSDPYCQVSIGPSYGRTKTVKHNLDPVWDETLYLFSQDLNTQRLVLRVIDEDTFESDDLLGYSMRGLNDLLDGNEQIMDISLINGTGSVKLEIQFFSFGDDEQLADVLSGSRMGRPVLGSPAHGLLSSPWRNLKELLIPAEAAAAAAFDPIFFVDNPESDTQAWVFWNFDSKCIVISFRGTEQTRLKDIITDLSLAPISIDSEEMNIGSKGDNNSPNFQTSPKGLGAVLEFFTGASKNMKSIVSAGTKAIKHSEEVKEREDEWVHAGFLRAYQSVRVEILQTIDATLADETEKWTIYCTGHSLGGALSTLCAYDIANRPMTAWKHAQRPHIVNYTYGSPRVGNRSFAVAYNKAVPNTWRIVNNGDAVASVPRLLGYAHVGNRVTIDETGMVEIQNDSLNSDVGEGDSVTDVASSVLELLLLTSAQPESEKDDQMEEIRTLIESEKQAMSSLLDGTAMADHLEPLYMERIEQAIKQFFRNE